MASNKVSVPPKRVFKILCLHGIGTNSDPSILASLVQIFEAQTASLRYHLGDGYEYDFIDGAHPWPAAPGIAEVFGAEQGCYSYSDGTAPSALTAVDDLATYVIENGPFDAVLSFSMGTALAATLLLRPRDDDTLAHVSARSMIRSAVFVCGTLPVDRDELRRGNMAWLEADQVGEDARLLWRPVAVPTVHAWSAQDTDHPGQSQQLVRMCVAKGRVELLHSAGHGFPSKGNEVAALAEAVQELLEGVPM